MKKKFTGAKGWISNHYKKLTALSILVWASTNEMFSQASGVGAITQTTGEIAKYIPAVQKLIYAIAGVVAVIGAISVYIKMNNEEQDVKKSIMMIVGACIFLIAAATGLPKFFGY